MAQETPDIAEQTAKFTPEFFLIPAAVMLDAELQPLDTKVFATIYWFEKMKDGYCRASNATIAKIVNGNSNSVNNSLARLREQGHIHCEYDEYNHRLAIITLHQMMQGGTSNDVGDPTSNDEHIKKKNIKNNNTSYTDEELAQATKLHKLYILHYKYYPDHLVTPALDRRLEILTDLSNRYKLTPKRLKVSVARLRECGYEMCATAVVKSAKNDFNLGQNDRNWKADLYEYILRNYEMVERLSQYGD